jgi:RNA polymerase sigma-70 factor (ECF subfamily)
MDPGIRISLRAGHFSRNPRRVPGPAGQRGVMTPDPAAWAGRLDAAYPRVERYVVWRCGGPGHLADDVRQDTWLAAARALGRFDPAGGDFADRVRGIAAGVPANPLRGRRRRLRRVGALAHDPAAPHREPDDAVAVAVAGLLPQHESALRRKYLGGATVAELATETSLSDMAAERLLARARQAFKAAYRAAGGAVTDNDLGRLLGPPAGEPDAGVREAIRHRTTAVVRRCRRGRRPRTGWSGPPNWPPTRRRRRSCTSGPATPYCPPTRGNRPGATPCT